MPSFDFKCVNCGKVFDAILWSWKEENPKCECGGATERQIGKPFLYPDGVYSYKPDRTQNVKRN